MLVTQLSQSNSLYHDYILNSSFIPNGLSMERKGTMATLLYY